MRGDVRAARDSEEKQRRWRVRDPGTPAVGSLMEQGDLSISLKGVTVHHTGIRKKNLPGRGDRESTAEVGTCQYVPGRRLCGWSLESKEGSLSEVGAAPGGPSGPLSGLWLSAWRDGRPQKVLSRVNTCCDLGPPWCLESSLRVAAGDPLGGYFGIQVRQEGSSQGGEL